MTPLLLLVGPTGSGKTATAIELCQMLDGEIVSADSMQIYRGCDIVTAKPSAAEQTAARHHLIDICDPRETYSAARWADDARRAIDDIASRGKTPIIAGGTGFYIRALLDPDLVAPVPPNPELRAELETELAAHGKQWLHEKLRSLDSAAAARLHFNDVHRVMRAIEVVDGGRRTAGGGRREADGGRREAGSGRREADGSQLSDQLPPASCFLPSVFGLAVPRETLYLRLETRVDAMLAMGALDELRGLLESGVPTDAPALQGVGYRQLLPALDDPSQLPAAVELWKRDTRRYAKRQMTWFRHQLPTQWFEIDESEPSDIARQIALQWRAGHHSER